MRHIKVIPGGFVRLTLPEGKDYKRFRTIGRIDGDTLITERSKETVMRAFGGSIGFNYDLIRNGKFTHVIVRVASGRTYRTLRQTILDYGYVLHYKFHHLDKQIFLPLCDFAKAPKEPIR